MSFLPGWFPAGAAAVGEAPYTPASMVFNGTDEALTRTLSTSGASTTIFTYSVWVKVGAYDGLGHADLFQVINAPTNNQFLFAFIDNSGDELTMPQVAGGQDWGEEASGLSPDISTGVWEHLVFRYDSTQGTVDNRLRFYRNGSLLTDSNVAAGAPGSNEAHILFANGYQHQIGAFLDISTFTDMKLAFIDVLEGVSAAPSGFAFSDGGIWTRQPYAGSYGTYGFSLDGSTGVIGADVSGNGQTFTGLNMDNSNLDTGDLPPYVT